MNNYYIIGACIVLVLLIAVVMYNREGLSLSQFPIPRCNTGVATYYKCGEAPMLFQEQNLLQGKRACSCDTTFAYRMKEKGSCFKPALAETFDPNGGMVTVHMCKEAAGTYDGGSTWDRALPCPVPIPPVMPGFRPIAQRQSLFVNDGYLKQHLDAGGLVIGANSGKVADYTLKKLVEQNTRTIAYPDFYYITGPVVVMLKAAGRYYWMIDYPIKYTPENFDMYVNSSPVWNIAQTMFHNGRRLLEANAPFFFFTADPQVLSTVRARAVACQPSNFPQSTTDYPFLDSP